MALSCCVTLRFFVRPLCFKRHGSKICSWQCISHTSGIHETTDRQDSWLKMLISYPLGHDREGEPFDTALLTSDVIISASYTPQLFLTPVPLGSFSTVVVNNKIILSTEYSTNIWTFSFYCFPTRLMDWGKLIKTTNHTTQYTAKTRLQLINLGLAPCYPITIQKERPKLLQEKHAIGFGFRFNQLIIKSIRNVLNNSPPITNCC